MNAQNWKEFLTSDFVGRKDTILKFSTINSPENYMPITLMKGKKTGKTITIVAGVHGYEYPPIMSVQRLIKDINPEHLQGNILFIPIANVASFQKRVPYVNPLDHKNLNHTFPGKENGTITEQIAYYITKEIIPISDIFLDIHGGDAGEDLIPFVCYYDNPTNQHNTDIARQLSELCGMPYVVSYPYTINKTEPAKFAFKQAVQDDKVGLSLEAGRLGINEEPLVDLLENATYRILAQLNIYHKPNLQNSYAEKYIFLNTQDYIKAPESGIFYSSKKAGDSVKKGEHIGYITDLFGKKIQDIFSTTEGIILYKKGTPPVNLGESMFCIGSLRE